MMIDAEKDCYSKGWAIGFCDIRTTLWHYRFRDETFELPQHAGHTTQHCDGAPVMRVERVRELAKDGKHG